MMIRLNKPQSLQTIIVQFFFFQFIFISRDSTKNV